MPDSIEAKRKEDSICWKCKNSVGPKMCSWAKEFRPVKGWNAHRQDLKATPKGGMVISYVVLACPCFEPDDPPKVCSNVYIRR